MLKIMLVRAHWYKYQVHCNINSTGGPVGSDRIIDVIDVTTQADLRMTLKDFVEYYSNPSKRLSLQQILNVISLEFSGSKWVTFLFKKNHGQIFNYNFNNLKFECLGGASVYCP